MKKILLALMLTGALAGAQTPVIPRPVPLPTPVPGAPAGTPSAATPTGPGPTPSATPLPAPPARPGGIIVPSDAGLTNAVVDTNGMVAISPPASATNTPPEEVLPAGTINFPATDLNQVLQIYAELVNRTILRPSSLPAATITLKTQTPLTRKEAIAAFNSVLALNGISMIDIGDKFVKAVPVAQANQEGAPFNKKTADQLAEIGQYLTHVVQLKYTKPTEMVQVLQPFAKIPNAILPVDSSQILVLRDNTENVKRMLEMIREIDVAVPSEFISEVIPIKYALASDISSALNSLSSSGGGTTVGSSGTTGTTGSRTSFGGSRGSTGMGGRTQQGGYGGMQGGYGGMQGLGTGMGLGGGTGTTSTGGSFTDRLQNIIRRASVTGDIVVLGSTKIIADERINALLVFASREDMKMIKDIVSKLDVVLAQVLIEAVIIEVSLGKTEDLALSYLQRPQTSGQATGAGALNNGKKFYDPNDFTGGATNALDGGFTYLFRWGNDLDVIVRALSGNSRSRVLQRPRIQTSHAVEAQLFVGESRPYPTGSYYGGGAYGGYSSIQQMQIGVTLSVTPLINPDGLVVMDIHQTIENAKDSVTIENVGEVPVTSRKEAMAKVAVRDRDTIMLGGLIDNASRQSRSGFPILMDIPLIGPLFRSSSSQNNRGELVVLIRPTVLPTPEIAAVTAAAIKDSMPDVREAEEEILGEEAKRLEKANSARERSRQRAPGTAPDTSTQKTEDRFKDWPPN